MRLSHPLVPPGSWSLVLLIVALRGLRPAPLWAQHAALENPPPGAVVYAGSYGVSTGWV